MRLKLTSAEAKGLLAADSQRYSTPRALRALAKRVSVFSPGALGLIYCGCVGEFESLDIVEAMIHQDDTIKVINKTEAAAFLSSIEFKLAVARVFKTDLDLVDIAPENPAYEFLYGRKAGLWAITSVRFISTLSGDVRTITLLPDDQSTFVQTELPRIVKTSSIKAINGMKREIFEAIFYKTRSWGKVSNALSASSYQLVGEMSLRTVNEKPVGVTSLPLFRGIVIPVNTEFWRLKEKIRKFIY